MLLRRTLDLEGLTVQLDSLTNFDELFDLLLAKGEESDEVRDERIPYWADLWPSAVGMGRYLVKSGLVAPETTVVEIGCGLGLPGIVAGMLGAKEVRFTDYLDEALIYAKLNWEINSTRPALFSRMDWRQPDPAFAADLVLASDVAYESRFFPDLPHAFRTLCKPGGRILFSEPCRDIARPFLDSLPGLGFSVVKDTVEGELNGLSYKVSIYDMMVKGEG